MDGRAVFLFPVAFEKAHFDGSFKAEVEDGQRRKWVCDRFHDVFFLECFLGHLLEGLWGMGRRPACCVARLTSHRPTWPETFWTRKLIQIESVEHSIQCDLTCDDSMLTD